MRVLLDECLPRRLGVELAGHLVSTVAEAGWSGSANGMLLTLISGNYDAFLTIDKNLPAQQRVAGRSFGIIVLRARTNHLVELKPLVPQIPNALTQLQPGTVVFVPPVSS